MSQPASNVKKVSNNSVNCVKEMDSSDDFLPIQSDYLAQIFQQIGAQLS